MEITTAKKITAATFKSFVRKNYSNLFIEVKSSFDGMTDCVEATKDLPTKIRASEIGCQENTLGIAGVWLVGSSRDYFRPFEDVLFKGIEVTNSCGRFIVAIMKEAI